MNGVLSPIGIYTQFLSDENVFSSKSDSLKFYMRVLDDNEQEFHLNSHWFKVEDFNSIIENGFIIFKQDGGIFRRYDDDSIIFPRRVETMSVWITSMQLKFLQSNINILNVQQQFIINDFLLSADLIPISEIFVKYDCMQCIHTNCENGESNVLKNLIINKCQHCNILKYNKKIKLIHDFTNNKNNISNKDKILEYKKNGFKFINGRYLARLSYDYYNNKCNFMRLRNELLCLT